MAEAKSTPPEIVVDNQDPLPESNWGYRRGFAFLALIALLLIKVYETFMDRQAWLTDLLILAILIAYMIAPSAEQATKMLATASMLKQGVTLRRRQQVSSSADQTHAFAESEANARVPDESGTPEANTSVPSRAFEYGDNTPPDADAPWFNSDGAAQGEGSRPPTRTSSYTDNPFTGRSDWS